MREKGKLLLNCQLINIEGIVKSRKSPFCKHYSNSNWSRQESFMDAKWKVMKKKVRLKVLPHKLFVNYKGENSNFILDKPADAILIQVNITITNEGINWHHVPFLWTSLLWYFCPKSTIYNLNLNMKRCQTNWHLMEIVFKITCLYSSKMSHQKKKSRS